MYYRSEIDGLRAFAVVPVVLFHAGFTVFSGGFVGVDVFFVISGYLITTILIEDSENNRLNIVAFYERRARRILPALLLVLLVTYLFSSLFYLPSAHKVVGQYVVSSIASASNVLLLLKGNEYFGLEAERNPLLHTWSLGVEEQFYIGFPLFFFVAWRFGKAKVFWIITVCAMCSLVLSEWMWRYYSIANFYLSPTRAWELLAGAMAAFILQKRGVQKSEALSLIGVALILFAVFFYDKNTPFPSVYGVAPVLGGTLIILFTDKDTIVGKLLGSKLLVGVGLISYSVYLWHLPLQVYLAYIFDPSIGRDCLYLVFLVGASYASYRWVENPFRRTLTTRTALVGIAGVGTMLSGLGVYTHLNGGDPHRSHLYENLRHNNG